jgi:hypothetical protein
VLHVKDAEACRRFWVERVSMVERRRDEVGASTIGQVGFADQPLAFSDPEGRWFAVTPG